MSQSTKNASSTTIVSSNQAESGKVLSYFLKLLSDEFNHPKSFWAPNSVFDWFGRTVRGPAKIYEHLKNEVYTQYQHMDFNNAQECDPIEVKPSHMKTKILSTQELDYVHTRNIVNTRLLKNFAESDDDDLEIGPLLTDEKISEKRNTKVIQDLTPPSTAVKRNSDFNADFNTDDEDALMEIKAKRVKLTRPTPFSYLCRLSKTSTGSKYKSECEEGVNSLLNDTSSDDEPEGSSFKLNYVAAYTPLRYLETKGILRVKSQFQSNNVGSSYTHESGGFWNREVRILISYRTCIPDDKIQFALVIYENLDNKKSLSHSRRGLMAEFIEMAKHSEDESGATSADERPALVINDAHETVVATVEQPTTDEIAAALESAAFTIVPLHTPTKTVQAPPATPKRKSRSIRAISGLKRLNVSPSSSSSKRTAVRSLRL